MNWGQEAGVANNGATARLALCSVLVQLLIFLSSWIVWKDGDSIYLCIRQLWTLIDIVTAELLTENFKVYTNWNLCKMMKIIFI